jgi:hypothetical protein
MGYYRYRIAFLVATFSCVFATWANPIPLDDSWRAFPTNWGIETPHIVVPILLEAVFVVFLLRRFRTPRIFILWIFGMHVLTYPLFLALSLGIQPLLSSFSSIVFAEVLIIFIEGGLIYSMCRYLPTQASAAPTASVGRCIVVLLFGNLCSIDLSLLLTIVYSSIYAHYRIAV